MAQKLAYEWNNIYRALRVQETFPKGHGLVTKATFEQCLLDNNVKLTKNEFNTLVQLYSNDETESPNINVINYHKMSLDLGLHSNKLAMIQPVLISQKQRNASDENLLRSEINLNLESKLRKTFANKLSKSAIMI